MAIMVKLKDWIVHNPMPLKQLGELLGVSESMACRYKKTEIPSINTAIMLYGKKGVVLFPYSEVALKELSKGWGFEEEKQFYKDLEKAQLNKVMEERHG